MIPQEIAASLSRVIKTGPYARLTYAEKFWTQVDVKGLNDCWEFQGKLDDRGYGYFNVGPHQVLAHRVAYVYIYGLMPEKLYVCHRCDNPKCSNPFHLFLGTPSDNIQDMLRKKRNNPARGERSGKAVLSEANVIRMRRMYREGVSQKDLALTFGISRKQISCIVNRVQWAHVKETYGDGDDR